MNDDHNDVRQENLISIARQPVFDRNQRLWGYVLTCIGASDLSVAEVSGSDAVALNMANSAYIGLQQIVDHGKKAILNFDEKGILDQLPYAMPSSLTVIQVAEDIYEREGIPEQLEQLKADGYQIAVTGFSGKKNCQGLYALSDIISIDFEQLSAENANTIYRLAKSYPATLMGLEVNDRHRFSHYFDLDFKLFLGSFFKTPDAVTVRQLTSNEVARFNLLQAIEKEESNFETLAETIQSDVSISFRLLAYLNSAAFGLRQKVKSIQHAISLLGWQKMKKWMRVVLLTDVGQRKEASELTTLAAQRGKFLELVAKAHDFWGFDPEGLHMLGIFSLLDAMLDTPMTEIVGYLPLDDKLKGALCKEPNNEYLPLLQLAQYYEEAHWAEAAAMVQQLDLDPEKVSEAFQKAVDWASELTTMQSQPPQS